MKIIVTGGAGFIGSNLILYLHEHYPEVEVLNIDKLTYASDLSYLKPIKDSKRYHFKKLDIVDRLAVQDIFQNFRPDGVIHLAAESHVDNSIKGPEPFIHSNIVGTFNLLDECRLLWQDDKFMGEAQRFLHISTDEVYGTLEKPVISMKVHRTLRTLLTRHQKPAVIFWSGRTITPMV